MLSFGYIICSGFECKAHSTLLTLVLNFLAGGNRGVTGYYSYYSSSSDLRGIYFITPVTATD